MRVFVTGGTGHLGSAVIPELLSAGHQVLALARSDPSADALAQAGAEVHRGSLDDRGSLHAAATAADGVIHLAFRHDAMQSGDFAGAVDSDTRAIETISDALAGTGKPFVSTSGTLTLVFGGVTGVVTEAAAAPGGPRIDAENAVIALAEREVRSSIVRLPPTVHSSLDHSGYIPILIATAREKGVSGYVGDGSNR